MLSLTRFGTCLFLAAAAISMVPTATAGQAPRRVVSMNVCTDQLAMLIAGEGQLHSVSVLASDPSNSVMVRKAKRYVANHALAEEIFLMEPDLVLAGTFSPRATVGLLRRLGFRVEEFAPAKSFADVRENITRIGELLGRQQKAAELVAELDRGLSRLQQAKPSGKTIALSDANSYTTGTGTLADEIFQAAGLTNIAEKLGVAGTVRLPMELLIMAKPDMIAVSNHDYGAPALAQENFVHPAYRALGAKAEMVEVPVPNMICGAPFTLEAAYLLQKAAIK
jgi:iron complex transport system substrate-binding protein